MYMSLLSFSWLASSLYLYATIIVARQCLE